MDIHQLKQRIDASGKKLVTLGNEYIKSKDEIAARKVLVKMFGEISQQTLLLGEQNAQVDRNQRGMKSFLKSAKVFLTGGCNPHP